MRRLTITIFSLSLLGTLFASSVMLRQYFAPTNVPGIFSCVGFKVFGFSPCPYGLGIFLVLTLLGGYALYRKKVSNFLMWLLRAVGLVGVGFSGWVAWRELVLPAITQGPTYWDTFSIARVPACVWGFLVFVAVAVLTWVLKVRPVVTSKT